MKPPLLLSGLSDDEQRGPPFPLRQGGSVTLESG